jgi:hypothetical protein
VTAVLWILYIFDIVIKPVLARNGDIEPLNCAIGWINAQRIRTVKTDEVSLGIQSSTRQHRQIKAGGPFHTQLIPLTPDDSRRMQASVVKTALAQVIRLPLGPIVGSGKEPREEIHSLDWSKIGHGRSFLSDITL